MANPGLIKGQLLASNLERVDDISINNQLLYVDVINQRVGINNTTPGVDLSVTGEISSSTLTDLGIVFANNGGVLSTAAGFQITPTQKLQTPGGFITTDTELSYGNLIGQNNLNIYTTDGSPISLGGNSGEDVKINGLKYPLTDGTNGQVLVTDGTGTLYFDSVASSFNITGDTGTDTFDLLGPSSLLFTGASGAISTTITDDQITFTARLASTTQTGVAGFNATNFDVNGAGFVTIKTGGVTATELANNSVTASKIPTNTIDTTHIVDGTIANADLQNSSITVGSTVFNLGDTQTEVAGLTRLDVDNLRLDGSTISSTATIGNIAINANNNGTITFGTQTAVVMPTGLQSARPTSPIAGMMRYNYTTNLMEYYNGIEWVNAGNAFTDLDVQTITPNGINSVFTLDHSATTNSVIVTLNGLLQEPVTAYEVSGGSIIFNEIPQATDIISIRYITGITSVVSISDDTSATEIAVTATDATIKVAGQDVVSIPATKVFDLTDAHSLQLPVYTVAAANLLTNLSAGQVIYVSNGDAGSPTLAVYDGTSWKRVALGATISAT